MPVACYIWSQTKHHIMNSDYNVHSSTDMCATCVWLETTTIHFSWEGIAIQLYQLYCTTICNLLNNI